MAINLGKRDKNNKYVINLNREGFDMDDFRKIQLVAYFHLLKLNFRGSTFNQISGEEENIYIPYTFSLDEELAIVTLHGMKMLYLELSESEYIEITFDQVRISLEDDEMCQTCARMLDLVRVYDLVSDIAHIDFMHNQLEWKRILLNEYDFAMQIGETFIKNGYMMCYPSSGEAFVVNSSKEMLPVKGQVEYFAIRSNVYDNRSILFLHQFQEVILLGFFDHEVEKIRHFLLTGQMN